MDIIELMDILVPTLPFLMKVNDKLSEPNFDNIDKDTWDKAQKIWLILQNLLEADENAKNAALHLAKAPEDEFLKKSFQTQLEILLKENDLIHENIKLIIKKHPFKIDDTRIIREVSLEANIIAGIINQNASASEMVVNQEIKNIKIGDALSPIKRESIDYPVYFATDRKQDKNRRNKIIYKGERNANGRLEYGLAKVNIPIDHRMGNIERPEWWKLEFSEDSKKHIFLKTVESWKFEDFTKRLSQSVKDSSEHDLLVFIHGYNTSFEDALLRTAQIAYDLHFPGQAFLYSWPSAATYNRYPLDETNIEWTIPHLKEFLEFLLTSVGASAVNVIAHSMGNRALARVLKEIDLSTNLEKSANLRHVIFAAPDIDADTFEQFAKDFSTKADSFTLYASSKDKALEASRFFHGGYPRAGYTGKDIVVVNGVDTIDASYIDTSFLGHSYIGDNRSILSDIFYLIKHSLSPDKRSCLVRQDWKSLYYWLFQA